jgi:hypothetical protein
MLLNLAFNHSSLTNHLFINSRVKKWIIWCVEHTCVGILQSVQILNIRLFARLMGGLEVLWLIVECLSLVKHLVVANCFLFVGGGSGFEVGF